MRHILLSLLFLSSSIALGQAALKSPNRALDQDHSLCVNDGGVEQCLTVDGPTSAVTTPADLSVTGAFGATGVSTLAGITYTQAAATVYTTTSGAAVDMDSRTIVILSKATAQDIPCLIDGDAGQIAHFIATGVGPIRLLHNQTCAGQQKILIPGAAPRTFVLNEVITAVCDGTNWYVDSN